MKNFSIVLFFIISLNGCGMHNKTSTSNTDHLDNLLDDSYHEEVVEISDKLEPINRVIFSFNDRFYRNVLDPVNDVYTYIIPQPVRNAIGNLLYEIAIPLRFAGSITQLDFIGALSEVGATICNLSGGLFVPIIDLVSDLDMEMFAIVELESDPEDLGQSLGYWNVPHGTYLVIPFFGPSSLRDLIGSVGEFYINPIPYISDFDIQATTSSLDAVNKWSLNPDQYGLIVDEAIDPYTALKNAYIQNRDMRTKE